MKTIFLAMAILTPATATAHGGNYYDYMRWYCVAQPDPQMCAYMKGLADE